MGIAFLFTIIPAVIFLAWMIFIFSMGAASARRSSRSGRGNGAPTHFGVGNAFDASNSTFPTGADPADPIYANHHVTNAADMNSGVQYHHDHGASSSHHHNTHDNSGDSHHSGGHDTTSHHSSAHDTGSASSYTDNGASSYTDSSVSSPSSYTDSGSSASSFDTGSSSFSSDSGSSYSG